MLDKTIKRIDKYNQTCLRHTLSCGKNAAVRCEIKLQEEAILTRKYLMILYNY